MRTLVIDCATEACSVALFDDASLIGGDYRLLGRGHAEVLVPMIAGLPGKGRAARIAVALGPGSFTGLRVGLAAARGLALAWQAELAGYSTPALVAAMARTDHGARPIMVAMNAGHGEWFVTAYDDVGRETHSVKSLPPAQAILRPEILVAGSRAEDLVQLRGFGESAAILPDARRFMVLPPSELVEPNLSYGRLPDARPAAIGQ